jgi:hypothetical protein
MLSTTRHHPAATGAPTLAAIASGGATSRTAQRAPRSSTLLGRLVAALHRSRQREAALVIQRYHFLLAEARDDAIRRDNEPLAGTGALPPTPSPSSWWDWSSIGNPIMSLRLKLLLTALLVAFAGAHIAGIWKLRASNAAATTAPATTMHVGD